MHARVGNNDDEKSSSSNRARAQSNVVAGEQCPSEPSEDNRVEAGDENEHKPGDQIAGPLPNARRSTRVDVTALRLLEDGRDVARRIRRGRTKHPGHM